MGRGNVSKIMKGRERASANKTAKAKRKAILDKMQDSIGAKGINELSDMGWGEKIHFIMSSAWIFNAWYEKALLLAFVYLGGWKILNMFGWFL